MSTWKIYDPDATPAATKVALPPPPPWRQPGPARRAVIASTFRATSEVVNAVNVALHLRRPLLITGQPGTGKSSLVYSVARQLGLGDVIVWAINSRSTLAEGLYRYDALARLQHIQQRQALGAGAVAGAAAPATPPAKAAGAKRTKATGSTRAAAAAPAKATRSAPAPVAPAVSEGDELGSFITLGPLGSALAAPDAPRALLIDEIDKSDVDLPNDLLNVLDTGSFPVAELQRVARDFPRVHVRNAGGAPVAVDRGVVSFSEFPFIVMTSNGERDFPAPFLRRCVQCALPEPDEAQLASIVRAHLPQLAEDPAMQALLQDFVGRRAQGALATDQFLNAQYLTPQRRTLTAAEQKDMLDVLFKALDG